MIGAAITRCEMHSISLNELVGIELRSRLPQRCLDFCEEINDSLVESNSTYMGMCLSSIMRRLDPTAPSLQFRQNDDSKKEEELKKTRRSPKKNRFAFDFDD